MPPSSFHASVSLTRWPTSRKSSGNRLSYLYKLCVLPGCRAVIFPHGYVHCVPALSVSTLVCKNQWLNINTSIDIDCLQEHRTKGSKQSLGQHSTPIMYTPQQRLMLFCYCLTKQHNHLFFIPGWSCKMLIVYFTFDIIYLLYAIIRVALKFFSLRQCLGLE